MKFFAAKIKKSKKLNLAATCLKLTKFILWIMTNTKQGFCEKKQKFSWIND